MTEKLSNKISNGTFLCTCLIVMHHIPHDFESWGGLGRLWLVVLVAVPFFFCVSGFLLAGHCGEQGWWVRAIRSRVKTLLIPYVIVNAIHLPIAWIYHGIRSLSLVDFLSAFGLVIPQNPACGQLWYVRMLMVLILLSPFFAWVIRLGKLAAVLFVGFLFTSGIVFPLIAAPFDPQVFNASMFFKDEVFGFRGLSYFCLGMVLRVYGLPRIDWRVACPSIVLGVIFLCCRAEVNQFGPLRYNIGMSVGPLFMIVGLWWGCPSVPWPKWLTSSSFAVYCFHMLVISGECLVAERLHCATWLVTPIGFIFCLVTPVVLCCWVYNVLRVHAPRVSALIFGGR